MPPNTKGGKNYKKGKHVEEEAVVYDKLPGQMYGRVIKLLGGCNALIFCNDGRERICHIRGNMRKKVWLASGDIVLISLRDFTNDNDTTSNRGDICAKYDQKVIYKLREKDNTINSKLFITTDKSDTVSSSHNNVTDGFIFESDDSDNERDKHAFSINDTYMPNNRTAQRLEMMIQNYTDSDDNDDDDINIDDI